jgi:hypothetical protein
MKGFKGELATWFYFLDEMFMGGICNMILLFRWNVYGGHLQHNFLTKGFMGEIVNVTSSFWWMGGIWQHASAFWLKGFNPNPHTVPCVSNRCGKRGACAGLSYSLTPSTRRSISHWWARRVSVACLSHVLRGGTGRAGGGGPGGGEAWEA